MAAARTTTPKPSADATKLHDAFGWKRLPPGPDVPAIMQVLGGKTPSELRQLRDDYQAQYGEPMESAAHRALGPLYGRIAPLLKGTSPAASELGETVAKAGFAADHKLGTVPTDKLYTTKNAIDAIYVDAKEIFPAIGDKIANAKHEVVFETFEWDPSTFSKQDPNWKNDPTMHVIDGLDRLQARLKSEQASGQQPEVPVKVYISIDGPARDSKDGNWGVDKARNLMRQLDSLGLDPKLVEVHVGVHERKVWGASHSKALVVDGYEAMVMGANPQRFNTLDRSWHDTATAFRGEAGMGLRANFDETWKESVEITSIDLEKLDGHADLVVKDTEPIVKNPAVEHPDLDADPALKNAELPIFLATRRAFDLRHINPNNNRSPQNQAILAALNNAKKSIKIESPNLNDDKVKQAIIDAVNRGVDVQIVLGLGFNSWAERQTLKDQLGTFAEKLPGPVQDFLASKGAGGSNEDTLVDLFARIEDPEARQRLQVKWNSKDGTHPAWVQEPGASHTKYMTVDGQVAITGSANMDSVSMDMVKETNIVIDSKKVTSDLDAKVFDPDFARGIDVIEWAKGIRDGKVPVSEDLDRLLGGDAKRWATELVASYER